VQDEKPSATAWRVALGRAAHQFFDTPKIFDDPLALRIVGAYSQGRTPETFFHERYPRTRRSTFVRALVVVRSRLAEDELAAAAGRGVRQYVVLGAGLDTFAYRNPHAGLQVFEVDHPATQAWKRQRLRDAGIALPPSLSFAPVDFERDTLANGLRAAGFDETQPALFSWLGVVVYLTRETIFSTLSYVAARPLGTEVVFDCGEPIHSYPVDKRAAKLERAARVAAMGEPWLTRFEPAVLAGELRELGFDDVEDLGPGEIARRFFGSRGEGPGGHIIRAQRMQRAAV